MSAVPQQFLAFVLFPDRVAVVLWQKNQDKISILAQSNIIEARTGQESELSTSVDTALDQLGETGLGVKNALFLVPSNWVENGDLAEKKKRFLKSLAHDLMLDPLGYVVLTDTLLAHEAAKSPKAFSGLILFDTAKEWVLEEVKDGFSLGFQTVGKSSDLSADTLELTSRLQQVTHTERILLVPLEESSQSVTEDALEAASPTPIEHLLPDEFVKISVQLGGHEILQALPEDTTEKIVEDSSNVMPVTTDTDDFVPVDLSQPIAEDNSPSPLAAAAPTLSAAGAPTAWDVTPQDVSAKTEMSPNGFVIHRSAQETTPGDGDEQEYEPYPMEDATPAKKRRFSLPKFSFSLPAFTGRKNLLMYGIGSAALLLLISGAAGYWSLSRSYTATATVWLAPQKVEQSSQFVAGSPTASASGALPLPGELISESVTLETEVPATGTKITGDPATGTVTLFNKTTQDKTFESGTTLKADDKTFEFTANVTIPAAETKEGSDLTITTTPGKIEAAVKATAIGAGGNIEKDTKLSVANFDLTSYEARAKDTFTGGSEREIQAVSQKDVDQAAQQLRQGVTQQVNDRFAQRQQDGNTIIPSEQVTVTAVQANPQVGEEAKFVKVSITAVSPGLQLTADQTVEEGRKLLATLVPEDQELLPDSVQFDAADVQITPDGKTFILQAKVQGESVVRLQAEALSEEVKGKTLTHAGSVLREKKGVARQEIAIEPAWIRWLFSKMPGEVDRIRLNIKLDRTQ